MSTENAVNEGAVEVGDPFEPHTFERDGMRPLKAECRELAKETTRTLNSSRWQTVKVYRTKAGTLILVLQDITCWQGESDSYKAEVLESEEAIVKHLEDNEHPLAAEIAKALGVSEVVE